MFWGEGHCGRDQTSILEGDGPDTETQERHLLTYTTSLSPFLLFFLSHKTSPVPTAKPFSPSAHNHLLFISFHKGGKTLCWIFCPQMERKRYPSLSASLKHLVSKAFLQQAFQGPLLCLLKVDEALESRFLSLHTRREEIDWAEGSPSHTWKAAIMFVEFIASLVQGAVGSLNSVS